MNTHKLTTLLSILQQSEYDNRELRSWIDTHTTPVDSEPKKWTPKLQLLKTLTTLTAPLVGTLPSLYFWNSVIAIPQSLVVVCIVLLATIKLRFLHWRGLTSIAIAGSYAKTSTRSILYHVLSEKFSVLQPQENYNTPIGIAKTILFSLTSKHQIFLTELGEYYRGDIRNLVRFVSPDYKILTPIGYAHLGKFKTQDNLENGLLELLTTNPKSDSLCVSTNKKIVLSHQIPTTKLDWYGDDDIVSSTVTRSGTEFTSPRYSDQPIYIPLFGKHNAINTLPAFWIGKKLGISNQEIINRLSTIPYIPHRLEPTHVENNILLLDNGYNANPGSSRESLAVLEAMNGSQKIICTPGFVDLGTYQEKENEEFGKNIAKICDLCIVITSVNHDAIIKGLLLGGMKKDSIISANSEIEGMNAIKERLLPSAVVLFENSVPQLYL